MAKAWILLFLASSAFASVIDVFQATNGHEPRVALRCGKIPYFVDVKSGHWVLDPEGSALCDTNKDDVKRYCQKVYGSLNITNIVEANEKVRFDQWCDPEKKTCGDQKDVVPYRCLVEEYEADALMVPRLCKFDHLHDQSSCMTKDEWKRRAASRCIRDNMELKQYGILLTCATDMFTGIEYVCCPRQMETDKSVDTKPSVEIDVEGLEKAIKDLQKYLPKETRGCDRSMYEGKRDRLEERHRRRIAAVVDEWDEAERRYKKLKLKDARTAEEKMRGTLQVFRETLAALEQEAKEERQRLRDDHANCINVDIEKKKHDAMLGYIEAIEEKPYKVKKILKTVRKFIQTCEHDRLHSLRHFEHVRNQDPLKAKSMRTTLLNHLKELNNIVNISISLLSYLPEVAQQFGLTHASDGVILKPMAKAPETVEMEPHKHDEVPEVLFKSSLPLPTPKPEKVGSVSANKLTHEKIPVKSQESKRLKNIDFIPKKVPLEKIESPTVEKVSDAKTMPREPLNPKTEEFIQVPSQPHSEQIPKTGMSSDNKHHFRVKHHRKHGHHKHHKHAGHKHGKHGHHHATENNRVPKNKWLMEGTKQPVEPKPRQGPKAGEESEKKQAMTRPEKFAREGLPEQEHAQRHKGRSFFRQPRSPAAFAAVIGLSCGALVIMLGIIIALVMRRNRQNQRPHVVLTDANEDDREHLVKMQKNGYENPTYKFFYY